MATGNKFNPNFPSPLGTVFERVGVSAKCQPGLHLVPISYSAWSRVLAKYTERNPACLCVQNGLKLSGAQFLLVSEAFGQPFTMDVWEYFVGARPIPMYVGEPR